jgi:transposase-like protein
MPRKSPYKVLLSVDEKVRLQAIARKYTSQYRDVMRAKIVLLAAEGLSNKEIGQRLDLPRQIVSKWRKRFFDQRLAGLQEKPRRGRPGVFPLRSLLLSKHLPVSCPNNSGCLFLDLPTMKSPDRWKNRGSSHPSVEKRSGAG